MKINSLSRDDALRSLASSENGLSDAEAAKRLSENGFNEIREARKTPLTMKFLKQFTHFLALLLWVGAALSFLSGYLHPGEGMATLGFAIVGVIVINAIFTFIQEYRAEKALEALKKLLPFYVQVIREGKDKKVHAREIVPGDVIRLSEGDIMPADARLIESSVLRVNNSSLTGESESLLRNHAPSQGELLESPNIVFAGPTVISGSGKALVFATGMATEFGRIAHLTSAIESGLSPLQKEIIKATRLVAVIAAVVGIFFFSLGLLIGRSFWDNFIFAIGITVALIVMSAEQADILGDLGDKYDTLGQIIKVDLAGALVFAIQKAQEFARYLRFLIPVATQSREGLKGGVGERTKRLSLGELLSGGLGAIPMMSRFLKGFGRGYKAAELSGGDALGASIEEMNRTDIEADATRRAKRIASRFRSTWFFWRCNSRKVRSDGFRFTDSCR